MQASPSFDALKRIPLIDIVRHATLPHILPLLFDDKRAETIVKIEAMEPALRALVWLSYLDQNWGRDGLHTFFFLENGDFAPQVLRSLRYTQLEREATVFAKAMALFGPLYPDKETRAGYFARSQPGRQVDEFATIPNDLNAFDLALMSEGKVFGSQVQFAEQISAYVERTPSLIAWAGTARRNMTGDARLNWLLNQLLIRNWQDIRIEISTWPKPYRQIFLLELFNAEMLNGGVHQFFYNSSGDLAPEVVFTMREVGLPQHADAIQRAIDLFEKPYPSDLTVRRNRYFAKDWSDWDEKLNAPTEEVDDGQIFRKMLDIINAEGLLPT